MRLADDQRLARRLPIAAGVFGMTQRTSCGSMRSTQRFFELAGCGGDRRRASRRSSSVIPTAQRRVHPGLSRPIGRTQPTSSTLSRARGRQTRVPEVKLAPLCAAAKGEPRCLLSVVDRTVEVQAENESSRRDAARQPDRPAQPAELHRDDREPRRETSARDREHAVLVVDMLRFSRINESMGSLAGDELLITFARRLISALRGGDVLARTGGNEFGILVGLKRGVDRCAGRGRAHPGGDGDPVQVERAGDPGRMRDRRRADAHRARTRRSCSATPSSRSSRPRRRASRRSMSPRKPAPPAAASRSRPSFAGRSTRTSSSCSTSR